MIPVISNLIWQEKTVVVMDFVLVNLGESTKLRQMSWIMLRFVLQELHLFYLSNEDKFCFHLHFHKLRHNLTKMKF